LSDASTASPQRILATRTPALVGCVSLSAGRVTRRFASTLQASKHQNRECQKSAGSSMSQEYHRAHLTAPPGESRRSMRRHLFALLL